MSAKMPRIKKELITVHLPTKILELIDVMIEQGWFVNRSEAYSYAILEYMIYPFKLYFAHPDEPLELKTMFVNPHFLQRMEGLKRGKNVKGKLFGRSTHIRNIIITHTLALANTLKITTTFKLLNAPEGFVQEQRYKTQRRNGDRTWRKLYREIQINKYAVMQEGLKDV